MSLETQTKTKFNDDLNWRYATKKFDASKQISKEDLDQLLESVQLSASSYGLQPYEVLVVENKSIREKLQPEAWNQSQITEASHLLIFASLTKVTGTYVENYLDNMAGTRNLARKDLQGLEDMIKSTILQLPQEQQNVWAAKQAYIALGNLMAAAAHMRIDACPMEGFNAESFDSILDLTQRDLTTTVIAPIGYRSAEDDYQHLAKVRKATSDLIHFV